MGNKSDRYIKGMFAINIILTIVLTFFYYFFKDRIPNFYVLSLFAIEILCILFGLANGKFKLRLKNNDKRILLIVVATQPIACFISTLRFGVLVFDIHKIFLFCGMISVCFFLAKKHTISVKLFNQILDIVLAIGLFACLFNLFVNKQYFQSLDLSIIMYYTWNFSSFFFTRATYGVFLSICAIIALYRVEKKFNIVYIILYIFFLLNVLITAARMEMLAVIMASCVYMLHSKRYRKIVIPIFFLVLILLIIYVLPIWYTKIAFFIDKYFLFFKGHGGLSNDVSTGRFELWGKALGYTDVFSFFFGHGLGSKDTIMLKDNIQILGQNLTSFHCGYVDLFFETGVFGVGVIFYIAVSIIKKTKMIQSQRIRNLLWGLMSIWFLVNIADSNLLPFTTDMFSPVASFFFFTFPVCLSNSREFSIND